MLILFGRNRDLIPVKTGQRPAKRCDFVDHTEAYVARRIAPDLRDAFEQHLIDCAGCQRAVHLGRISTPLNHHNESVGRPCAAQTRRKS
jgi:hypothetical protein